MTLIFFVEIDLIRIYINIKKINCLKILKNRSRFRFNEINVIFVVLFEILNFDENFFEEFFFDFDECKRL